jgi:hypothetical protein
MAYVRSWWRLSAHAWLAAVLLGVLAGCGSPELDAPHEDVDAQVVSEADAEQAVAPARALRTPLTVMLTPDWAPPGAAVALRIDVPDTVGLEATAAVTLDGMYLTVPLSLEGDRWVGEFSLIAPSRLADHVVDVRVPYEGGQAIGYAVLAVSEQPACPDGQRRQGDVCYDAFEGSILNNDTRLIRINRHGMSRTMAHPRAVRRVGDKIVACICDALAVVRMVDLVGLDDSPETNFDEANDATPAWSNPYTETMLHESGLAHCNDLVIDAPRGIAMVASRGNLTGPGGLATWRFPNLEAAVATAPEPLELWETGDGFERLTWDGELLYGTQHPSDLVTMAIGDDGAITEVSRVSLEGALSVWALAKEGDTVYVTDAGDHQLPATVQPMHNGQSHPSGVMSGRIYAVDVSEPEAPVVLGWTTTTGLGKGVATLGDGMVAVAGGTSGLELVDLSNPRAPKHLHTYPTFGLSHGVDASDGLLVAGAWDSVMLFDASERGVLRLLDVDGLVRKQIPPSFSSHGSYGGLFGAGFVELQAGELTVIEWNTIMTTSLQMGGGGPRAVFSERILISSVEKATPDHRALRVRNGGRETLTVTGVPAENISFLDAGSVVPPMGYVDVNVVIEPELSESSYVMFETNDPDGAQRAIHLARIEGNYNPGDPAPPFRVPSINRCDGVAEGELCDMDKTCFDSRDPATEGKPLLIAFFSSW